MGIGGRALAAVPVPAGGVTTALGESCAGGPVYVPGIMSLAIDWAGIGKSSQSSQW